MRNFSQGLRGLLSDQVVAESLDDCSEIMRTAMNVGSAKITFAQAQRHVIGQLVDKTSAMKAMIGELADTRASYHEKEFGYPFRTSIRKYLRA